MKNKNLLIGLGLLVLGVVLGWSFTARYYGEGPIAGLSGLYSSANEAPLGLCPREYNNWAATQRRVLRNPSHANMQAMATAEQIYGTCLEIANNRTY